MLESKVSEKEISIDHQFLADLVGINSQTKSVEGVLAVINEVKLILDKMGLDVILLENKSHDSAPLLVANLNSHSETLAVICHADTVIPAGLSPFRQQDDKFIGAGIADNKAGIFVALKGIQKFLEKYPNPSFNIQLICSPNEELGSLGFHQFFSDLGLNAQIVLGFEPAFGEGDLISSRNGNKWYKLHLKGKSFHSGRAHKSHINSAHDLCRIVNFFASEMSQHPDVTMNVGEIKGGHSFNTICGEAYAKVDTRFKCFSGLNTVKQIFETDLTRFIRFCEVEKIRPDYLLEVHDYCPPLEFSRHGHVELDFYLKSIQKIENCQVNHIHCGGAADINHFWQPEQKGFDGLGAVGGNLHRVDEYVLIDSLETRSLAFLEFLNYYQFRSYESIH